MKLEKKQIPLFVGLCVVTAGTLGYAGYSLMGGAAPKPAEAGTTTDAAAAPAPVLDPQAQAAAAGLPPLEPFARADPFRPAFASVLTGGPPPPSRPAKPEPPAVRVAERVAPAALPPVPDFSSMPWSQPAPVAVRATASPQPVIRPAARMVEPPSAPPVRPALTLTGIIEGENPVAILRLSDAQRQVVQEKDRVAGDYVVDEIASNEVVLVSSRDRWKLTLEN
jgi:hypothetical protein